MRVVLTFDTFDTWQNDFDKMFLMGFRLDMRAVCVVAGVIIFLGYLASAVRSLSLSRLSALPLLRLVCDKILKFIPKFTLFFTTLSSFLIIISTFVNVYYFKTYHTKIDIFIFGLKDDDTEAILRIIWADYPVLTILVSSVLFAFVCFKISQRILNLSLSNSAKIKGKFAFFVSFALNLILVLLVYYGSRGSFGEHPLSEAEHHISANPLINHIATNPLIALSWARNHYKHSSDYAPINLADLKELENELFPVFRHNSQNAITKKPNAVVVLMESFGSNLLMLDDRANFDLLMSFRAHFEAGKTKHKEQNDFTFMNFLSNYNSTVSSFVSLFFLSPSAKIAFDSVKNEQIALTPFEIYKKAGYETIYITSGNRAWESVGDYVIMLGADAVYDSNFLMSYYPQSKNTTNVYGVLDEFAYKFALELLQKTEKPLFIVLLTTTNHPPYILPQNFVPPKYDLETKIPLFRENNKDKIHTSLSAFSYASNAFGDFVTSIKNSNLAQNTIIAGSGDHTFRDFKASHNVPLNHAVPFYLYVPNTYTKDFKKRGFEFDPQKLGSHKDILPTLYALSLNEYDYLSVGGRNLFDKNAPEVYEFALNERVWVDDEGIYPANSKVGYKYTQFQNGFIMQTNETFELSKRKAEFLQKYQNLERLQLNYRLFQYGK